VGKTEVARVLSRILETPLIRLQCQEGLDITHAVCEWNYPRQLLEIQARGEPGREVVQDIILRGGGRVLPPGASRRLPDHRAGVGHVPSRASPGDRHHLQPHAGGSTTPSSAVASTTGSSIPPPTRGWRSSGGRFPRRRTPWEGVTVASHGATDAGDSGAWSGSEPAATVEPEKHLVAG